MRRLCARLLLALVQDDQLFCSGIQTALISMHVSMAVLKLKAGLLHSCVLDLLIVVHHSLESAAVVPCYSHVG
jgi:hypothetical protein